MRSTKAGFTTLLTVLLLLSSMGGVLAGPKTKGQAAPGRYKKTSDDLDAAVLRYPNKKVRVIVQTTGAPPQSLASSISSRGGSVKRSYRNLKALAVEVPANAVNALTSNSDVKFVSLDRSTQ